MSVSRYLPLLICWVLGGCLGSWYSPESGNESEGRGETGCRRVSASDSTCDGVDDDCDGLIDDDFSVEVVHCGLGACRSEGERVCLEGVLVEDCEPGAPKAGQDVSCDGVDDDCDGLVDEDHAPSEIHCGQGACRRQGLLLCQAGSLVEQCQPGAALADSDSSCDAVDDDCDGVADEDHVATVIHCGEGACRTVGARRCVQGHEAIECHPPEPPTNADTTCDGIDDDCDGLTDEDYLGRPVSCGAGACRREGSITCLQGSEWEDCRPGSPLSPRDTTCDGVDDDCDGQTDEDYVGRPVSCGTGACLRQGSTACSRGFEHEECRVGSPLSQTDTTCDGVDDDCDGHADEDYQASPVTCGVGACIAGGWSLCEAGMLVDDCTPGLPAPDDQECDGVDDDCDSLTDEDYTPMASCGIGYCRLTNEPSSCAGGIQTPCVPGAPGSTDDAICDGIDDDCDGLTDEDYLPTGGCGLGMCHRPAVCVEGVEQCHPGQPEAESCNEQDDDCDGEVDEGCNGCSGGTVVPEGWVCIPAGTFVMGGRGIECAAGCACSSEPGDCLDPRCAPDFCPGGEGGSAGDRQHHVTLTRPFLMLSTEVTMGQWVQARWQGEPLPMGRETSDPALPAHSISWYAALLYCNWLSEQENLPPCYRLASCVEQELTFYCDELEITAESVYECPGYRLPTDAEWEYAARAGTLDETYVYPESSTGIAWTRLNTDRLMPVALLEPNPWGLYDVLGNVDEFAWDRYQPYMGGPPIVVDPTGPMRGSPPYDEPGGVVHEPTISRGGHFRLALVRVWHRPYYDPASGGEMSGFRIVRTLPSVLEPR